MPLIRAALRTIETSMPSTELWYWNTNGRIKGPLTTGELEALVRQGRIRASDTLRVDGSSEWLSGKTICELFDEDPAPAPTVTASQSAARLLQQKGRHRGMGAAHAIRRAGIAERWLGSVTTLWEGAGSLLGSVFETLAERLSWLRPLFTRKGLAVMTLLIATVWLATQWGAQGRALRTSADRLAQIADEAASITSRPDNDTARRELAERALPEIQEILSRLEPLAAQYPVHGTFSTDAGRQQALARQQLILAARALQRELSGKTSSEKADPLLAQANRYLAREVPLRAVMPQYPSWPPATNQMGVLTREEQAAMEQARRERIPVAVLAVINVLLLGAVAVIWWKRR